MNPHLDIVAKLPRLKVIILNNFGHGLVDSIERLVQDGSVIKIRASQGFKNQVGAVEIGDILGGVFGKSFDDANIRRSGL